MACGPVFSRWLDVRVRGGRWSRVSRLDKAEQLVLGFAVAVRLYLAVVNSEANDDHLTVIRIIVHQHRLPHARDAWEGFQPKLYHVTVALLWQLSPLHSPRVLVRVAQLVACAAGIATLVVIRRFLLRQGLRPSHRVLVFSFVALNPTLIGLNAQATNDSFVILFATVGLDQGWRFFRTGSMRAFLLMAGAVTLAALSKGNGLVIFFAITACLVHALLSRQSIPGLSRGRLARWGAAFVVGFAAVVWTFGSYRVNYQDTGDPFVINGPKAPLPHLIDRTYVYRPGTTSILDTYLTFRLLDMLEHPVDTNDAVRYPLHRTSLWSQLYGRANFAHFAEFPPSWQNTGELVLTLGRAVFLLALVPTALLVAGFGASWVPLVRPRAGAAGHRGRELFVLSVAGYVAFIVAYTLVYRDFSTMKIEFLFPAILPLSMCLGDGLRMTTVRGHTVTISRVVAGTCVATLGCYVADVLILAKQLT